MLIFVVLSDVFDFLIRILIARNRPVSASLIKSRIAFGS